MSSEVVARPVVDIDTAIELSTAVVVDEEERVVALPVVAVLLCFALFLLLRVIF